MSQNFRASYTETLGKLETQYCKLMVSGLGVGLEWALSGLLALPREGRVRPCHPALEHPCSEAGEGGRSRSPSEQGRGITLRCVQETSSFRLRNLQSLHGFVSRATAELIWLNEKEEEELAYDWSDNNPNIAAKKNYFSVSDPGAGLAGWVLSWGRAGGTGALLGQGWWDGCSPGAGLVGWVLSWGRAGGMGALLVAPPLP